MAFHTSNNSCSPSTFSSFPPVFGIEPISIVASLIKNFTAESDASLRYTHPSITADNLTFCNVTVTYTHPETNDEVNIESWLPASGEWNERLYAAGGGAYGAGRFLVPYATMTGALAEGYATVTTDAGQGWNTSFMDGSSYALSSPGNVNLQLAQNFAATSLNEMAVIAKLICERFYGTTPSYSYWNGCSQGGRQGLAIAQRYPNAFDGIAAGAPAINLPQVFASIFWPQQYMNERKSYPFECEVDGLVRAAITDCDPLDGVVDGILSEPYKCRDILNIFDHVGTLVDCPTVGKKIPITTAAASVVNATWAGASASSGRKIWHGLTPGANLTGRIGFQAGLAGTECTSAGDCTGRANPMGPAWLRYFASKNETLDVQNLSREQFQNLVRRGIQEFSSFFATNDIDLTEFRDAGGRLLTWHGLADDAVPPRATSEYYEQVSNFIPDVNNFYKHYDIPGLAHCSGGAGGQPTAMFQQLRDWVEKGIAPESSLVTFDGIDGTKWDRIICPHPQSARLQGDCANPQEASCWKCA